MYSTDERGGLSPKEKKKKKIKDKKKKTKQQQQQQLWRASHCRGLKQ